MVQRKLAPKPHHLENQNQSHDATIKNNNRVADLKKKKMKKSGSIKRLEKPPPPPPRSSAAAATTTPNYMKPTTSSDARKEQSQVSPRRKINSKLTLNKAASANLKTSKNPSFKPARKSSPVVVLCENLVSQKATCSSTLKDCKFPNYLSLNRGGTESSGTSAIKVCPYTYCSLNGHHHAPLKCFLSARRRVVKKNRVVKKDDSLGSKIIGHPVVEEEEERDFFIEIYSERIEDEETLDDMDETLDRKPELLPVYDEDEEEQICFGVDDKDESLDENGDFSPVQEERKSELLRMYDEVDSVSSSDMDLYDYEYATVAKIEPDLEIGEKKTENHPTDGEIDKGGWFDEFFVDQVSQESVDEESLSSDAFSTTDDDDDDDDDDKDDSIHSYIMMKNAALEEAETEPASDDKNHSEIGNEETDNYIFEEGTSFDDLNHKSLHDEDTIAVNEDSALVRGIAKCKKPMKDAENELGLFNPRGPNFLPIEPDPEAEKVDLRHQDLDETKNAEEWMVDYALRQVVTKLGLDRKRKVALLVEAFERVTPISKQSRHIPIQACS